MAREMLHRTVSGSAPETALELGFTTGTASTCHFYQKERKVCGIVHSGDFVFVGDKSHLERIAKHRAEHFDIKLAMTGQDEPGELHLLNRSTKWTAPGIEHESDHRHADRLIEESGLAQVIPS